MVCVCAACVGACMGVRGCASVCVCPHPVEMKPHSARKCTAVTRVPHHARWCKYRDAYAVCVYVCALSSTPSGSGLDEEDRDRDKASVVKHSSDGPSLDSIIDSLPAPFHFEAAIVSYLSFN